MHTSEGKRVRGQPSVCRTPLRVLPPATRRHVVRERPRRHRDDPKGRRPTWPARSRAGECPVPRWHRGPSPGRNRRRHVRAHPTAPTACPGMQGSPCSSAGERLATLIRRRAQPCRSVARRVSPLDVRQSTGPGFGLRIMFETCRSSMAIRLRRETNQSRERLDAAMGLARSQRFEDPSGSPASIPETLNCQTGIASRSRQKICLRVER